MLIFASAGNEIGLFAMFSFIFYEFHELGRIVRINNQMHAVRRTPTDACQASLTFVYLFIEFIDIADGIRKAVGAIFVDCGFCLDTLVKVCI